MSIPSTIKVFVDNRERKVLPFPDTLVWSPAPGVGPVRLSIKTESKRLDAGDILLADWPAVSIVERKGSLRELYNNLFTRDKARAGAAFQRLASACAYPYLLLEGSPADWMREAQGMKIGEAVVEHPGVIVDRMLEVVSKYNLHLIWCSSGYSLTTRRLVGETVLRALLRHAYDYDQKRTGKPRTIADLDRSKKNGKKSTRSKPKGGPNVGRKKRQSSTAASRS